MSSPDFRKEGDRDFREGTALAGTLRFDYGEDVARFEQFEESLTISPELHFEFSERERLAQLVRKKYQDKVVAVDIETGEELAVADDTHKLTEILLNLDYNKESTMIVRCDGQQRDNPPTAEEIFRRRPG